MHRNWVTAGKAVTLPELRFASGNCDSNVTNLAFHTSFLQRHLSICPIREE